LILGVILDGGFSIIANGIDIPSESFGDDRVIDLGHLGPNIDLTISGQGTFVIGGAVPEASTWAMMLVGFAGLGFVGHRQMHGRPQSA
jgi:PEP-CTERM motif